MYLSVSCCTGTEPKHSVSNGVLQHHTLFNVSNGVRQGGILAPYLNFRVRVTLFATQHIQEPITELSNMLNNAGIGCHIHNCCTNHVFYADNICVIVPVLVGFRVC